MNAVALRLIGIAVLVMALLGGAWALVDNLETRGAAKEVAARRDEHAVMVAVAASAAASTAADNARIQAKQEDALNDAKKQAADAVAARLAGDARSHSWRLQLDAFVAASRGVGPPSPAPGSGSPASDPIGVLAEVLRGADSFADGVSKEADANRIAGLLCERSYDAVATSQPSTPESNQ